MQKNKEKFDSDDVTEYMEEIGVRAKCEAEGAKAFIATQIKKRMEKAGTSTAELARRMHTSRPSVDRLLKHKNGSVSLVTLEKAAHAVNCRIRVELEPINSQKFAHN